MNYYISHIKDAIGQNYLGIKIDTQKVTHFLSQLKDHLKDDYEEYVNNQQRRDRGSYHLTVINVMDYNRLANDLGLSNFVNSLDKVFGYVIDDLRMMGIGTAQKNENTTYFIVCKSEKLDAVRKRYNLPEHDFHITIGFKHKDVFGVRKNQVMDFEDPFLSIIITMFEEEKNWDFIKDIKNFTYDKNLEVVPIDVKDTYMVFSVGEMNINVGMIDNQLRITAEYKSSNKPRMSMAKILDLSKK